MLMDMLDQFKLGRAGANHQDFLGIRKTFNNLMQKTLRSCSFAAAQCAAVVVQVRLF